MPADANAPEFVERVRAARPDFLFSFYYRQMLDESLLATASRGAYNMHGSLLPKYRGRAPVNWAVLHGETETGATLHAMTRRADAGGIVDAQAVPILGDDTAIEVFRKVTVAAEIDARARAARPSGRHRGATAPEYWPGQLLRTPHARRWRDKLAARGRGCAQSGARGRPALPRRVCAGGRPCAADTKNTAARRAALGQSRSFELVGDEVQAVCPDGALRLLEFELDGKVRDAAAFRARFGAEALPLADGQRNLQEAGN